MAIKTQNRLKYHLLIILMPVACQKLKFSERLFQNDRIRSLSNLYNDVTRK